MYEKPVPDNEMTIRPVPPSFTDRIGMKMVTGFLGRLPAGELCLTAPDGQKMKFGRAGSQPSLDMTIREYRFFRRVMVSGDIGFGEAYIDGDWRTSDLPGLLTLFASNEAVMDDRSIVTSAIGRTVNYLRHLRRPNTIRGSDRNIREHYDLSNEFFAKFLDPSMTYSCALFNKPGEVLEQTSHNVIDITVRRGRGGSVAPLNFDGGHSWLPAAALAACLVLGVFLGAAGYLETTASSLTELAGLNGRATETVLLDDGFGAIEEDYL